MKKIIVSTILLPAFLMACKPTEKGYKEAYDTAFNKRQEAMADIDVSGAVDGIQRVDGPQLKEIDGVKVYILNQRISPESGEKLPGNYNVAIGTYKMSTNCLAQAQNLKEEGFEAFAAKATDGMYYTIAGSFDSLSDAVKFSVKYKSGKNRVYVGLPDAPVIIYSPK